MTCVKQSVMTCDHTRSYTLFWSFLCFWQVRESFSLIWCWNRLILVRFVKRSNDYVTRYIFHNFGAIWPAITTGKIVSRFEVNVPWFEKRQEADFKFLEKSWHNWKSMCHDSALNELTCHNFSVTWRDFAVKI